MASTSITARNVPEIECRSSRWRFLIVVLAGVFLAHSESEADSKPIERRRLLDRLLDEVRQDPRLPRVTPIIAGLERTTQVQSGGRLTALVPLEVRYARIANRYCRLAVVGETVSLVSLPADALYDNCLRIRHQWLVSTNGERAMDVMQVVTVPSNRHEVEVDEIQVYLADASAPSGYCYSSQASAVASATMAVSAEDASLAFTRERQRLGLSGFQCDRR